MLMAFLRSILILQLTLALLAYGQRPERFSEWIWADYCFLGVVLVSILLLLYGLITARLEKVGFSSALGFGGFFALGASLRFLDLERFSLWLDECTQITMSRAMPTVLQAAANHQQTPLGYAYTFLGDTWLPKAVASTRLFPALWGSMACGVFFLLLWRHLSSRWLAVLGALAFCFHPWLIRYSVEGRSISLSIFAFVMVLFLLLETLNKKEVGRQDFFDLFCVMFVYLQSTFLQPSFSLASLIVVVVLWARVADLPPKNLRLVAMAAMASMGASLPLFLHVVSRSYQQYMKLPEPLGGVSPQWNLQHSLIHLIGAYGLGAAVLVSVFLLSLAYQRTWRQPWVYLAGGLGVWVCLFVVSYMTSFGLFIDWWFSPRYVLSMFPAGFMAGLLAIDGMRRFAGVDGRRWQALVACVFFGVGAYQYYHYRHVSSHHFLLGEHGQQFNQLYAKIRDLDPEAEGKMHFIGTRHFSDWYLEGSMCAEWYIAANRENHISMREGRLERHLFLRDFANPEKLRRGPYLLVVDAPPWKFYRSIPFKEAERYEFNQLSLHAIRFTNEAEFVEAWMDFVNTAISAFQKNGHSGYGQYLELKFWLAYNTGDLNLASEVLKDLVNLGLDKNPQTWSFYEDVRGELTERANAN